MRNSQHRRSLVTGLILAAVTPVIITIFLVLLNDVSPKHNVEFAIFVSLVGLVISITSTILGALPLFIFLRRKSILYGLFLCLGCTIIGIIAIAITQYIVFIAFDSHFTSQSFELNITSLVIGAGFGLVAGLALTCGSGTPFWRASRNSETKT